MTCGLLFAAVTAVLIYAVAVLYKNSGADEVIDEMNRQTRGDL